jgi:phosphate uptake regulator
MEKFNQLKTILTDMTEDMEKFYSKGNKSAGVRIRQQLQDVKALAQEIRKEISEKKKEKKDKND